MNSYNPLDDQFQKKLGNMSVQPRAEMWDKIQEKLVEEADEKVLFGFANPLWLGIGAVAFCGLVAVAIWNSSYSKGDTSIIASRNPTDGASLNTTAAGSQVASRQLVEPSHPAKTDNTQILLDESRENSATKNDQTIGASQHNYGNLNSTSGKSIEIATSSKIESRLSDYSNDGSDSREAADLLLQQPIEKSNWSEQEAKIEEPKAFITEPLPDEKYLSELTIDGNLPSVLLLPRKANTKKFRLKNDGLCYGDDSPDHHFTTELYLNVGGTIKHLSSKIGDEQSYIQKRQDSETSLINLGFGGRMSYILKRDFVFKVGFDYYQLNEKFVNKNSSTRIIILIDTIQTDMGPKVVTSTYQENGFTVNRYQNKYKMIDLPVSMGYQFRQKNFLLQVNGGASMNLTFIQEGKIVNNLGTPISIDRFDPNNSDVFKTNLGVSLFGSVQLQVPLSKSNYFFVEPTIRYTLNDITRPSYGINQKLTMVGSQFGIGFKL